MSSSLHPWRASGSIPLPTTERAVRIRAYASALAIGIVHSLWLFPLAAIWPFHPLNRVFSGDMAQSVTGQRYFLAAPWGWPPLVAPKLDWPAGLSVGLTDSIPLALLALKPFRAWLPPGFYMQQGWVALVWALQPVAFVWALRSFGERRLAIALAGAVLSLCPSFLIVRYGHNALATQAVILAAFALYASLTRQPSAWRWSGAILLLAVTSMIHPYLLAMVAAVLLAAPVTLLLRGDRQWRGASLGFAAGLLLCSGLMVVLGYSSGQTPEGYGFYSMNLLAPVLPQQSALFGDHAIDATGGQAFEGFDYLGAGVLLLLGVGLAVVVRRPGLLPWRRHGGLVLLAIGLTLFAVSATPAVGHRILFSLRHVPGLVQQLRATGRFFWPVAYLVMLGALVILPRALPWRLAVPIVVAATGLQALDSAVPHSRLWHVLRSPDPWTIDAPALTPVFAAHDRLTIWPPFGCGADVSAGHRTFEDLLLLASRTTMRTNTMYASRAVATPDCDAVRALGAPLLPGELRVISPPANLNSALLVPGRGANCRRSGELAVCSATPAALGSLPAVDIPAVPLRQMQGVSALEERVLFLDGWAQPSPVGTWTMGPTARVMIPLPPGSAGAFKVTLAGMPITPAEGQPQRVIAAVDGRPVGDWSLGVMAPQDLGFSVTLAAGAAPVLTVALDVMSPTPASLRFGNHDDRPLGFLLQGLRVDPVP